MDDTDEELGLGQRLVGMVVNPVASFTAVRRECSGLDWMVPTLLVCMAGLAYHFTTGPVTLDPETPIYQEQLQKVPPDQREAVVKNAQIMRQEGWMMMVTGPFPSLLVVAGALLFVGRVVFKAEITFGQVLAVKGYASVAVMAEWLVRIPLTLASAQGLLPIPLVLTGSQLVLPLGPGFLVPESMQGTLWGNFIAGVNLFDLWQVWLLGVGLGVVGRVHPQRAMWAVVALWFLVVTTSATVATMSQRLSQQIQEGTVPSVEGQKS